MNSPIEPALLAPSLHEAARLEALHRLELLDTPPSEAFDRITRMAAQLFNLPIAAVSLTDSDRQWFKSKVGVGHDSIPRLRAPCAEVADTAHVLVVPDLLENAYFRDSKLAADGIRFYAGAPLVTSDGFALGAMCVLGTEPRQVTEAESQALQDLATMVMTQIELQHALGRIDPVSGLPNRNQFIVDFNDMELAEPAGDMRLAALVSLASPQELSDAQRVMGAGYLDEMVRDVVPQLRLAGSGKIFHVGSTQFAFFAPRGVTLETFRTQMQSWLDARASHGQARFITTVTVGIAPFTVGQTEGLDLLRNMHSAAHDGLAAERCVRVFSSEHDAILQRRFWLVNAFGAALESRNQLHLVYQPKVGLHDGACASVEALLRWSHPEAGVISPGEFIPVIEGTSLARATTEWVLAAAMRQMAAWRQEGVTLQVAVNVSAVNLEEPDFCDRVLKLLVRHGLSASNLAIELTESALMRNPKVAQGTLERLTQAGVQLAIDDFGTGYSSLSYLQSLPANVVKIDQSFMRNLAHDERRRALVGTMIKLSHDLGHKVVAEGVETVEVEDFLRAAGCDEVQGYLHARPLAPNALAEWLAGRVR
ncbi:sensor domain-containing phosphodiesterase [Massilia sp. CFBP9026]|uniref:sensor domain-containing phosphodiesterase n=1 Tax=Massilia sp. CFBP9026 TaxID=3096536 RepID=UPI002A6A1CC0|nr:EAL domain-containing protein [Massilia sp. CFBP9026]MDY0961818.1 EAL domain-containing protein [Massilia sp. CFBP9026]